MRDPLSPYAQQDTAFRDLLLRVRYATQCQSLKMLVLIRKKHGHALIWLCTTQSKDPRFVDTWGTGESPLEALTDLAEQLGVIPPEMPEEGKHGG